MMWSFFLTVVLGVAGTTAQQCQIPTGAPGLTKEFKNAFNFPILSADVEKYDEETQTVEAIKLVHGEAISRITSYKDGKKRDVFYMFAEDDILVYDYYTSRIGAAVAKCNVVDGLSISPLSFIVGGFESNKTQVDLLHLFHMTGLDADKNPIDTRLVGNATIRDRPVDKYTSCQRWMLGNGNIFDATVTQYFSAANWSYPNGIIAPVQMEVTGQVNGQPTRLVYSFFNVNTRMAPGSLETIEGVSCKGRKRTSPFPKVPKFLKWTMEMIDRINNFHSFTDEIYDTEDMIAKITQQSLASSFTALGRFVSIKNYRSGLNYRIDQVSKECTIENITETTLPFHRLQDDKIAVIPSVKNLFFEDKSEYTYVGQRLARGIVADVWAADVKIPTTIGNATIEWFFAVNQTKTWNAQLDPSFHERYRVPLKARIWKKDFSDIRGEFSEGPIVLSFKDYSVDLNFFAFDVTRIRHNDFNIRPCLLPPTTMGYFQLMFRGVYQVVFINEEKIEWQLIKQIADVSHVHWLRVGTMKLSRQGKDLNVNFIIMEHPPVAGDVNPPYVQNTIKQARDAIVAKVQSDDGFFINVDAQSKGTTKKFISDKSYPVMVHLPTPSATPANGMAGVPGEQAAPVIAQGDEDGLPATPFPDDDDDDDAFRRKIAALLDCTHPRNADNKFCSHS